MQVEQGASKTRRPSQEHRLKLKCLKSGFFKYNYDILITFSGVKECCCTPDAALSS